jgi:hypothetical protein
MKKKLHIIILKTLLHFQKHAFILPHSSKTPSFMSKLNLLNLKKITLFLSIEEILVIMTVSLTVVSHHIVSLTLD